jgi:hypothetical protein
MSRRGVETPVAARIEHALVTVAAGFSAYD